MVVKKDSLFKKWKEGVRAITPLQIVKINLNAYILILIGIVLGIITSILNQLWWLVLILFGSLVVSVTAYIGLWQKYQTLKSISKFVEEVKNV